MKPPHEHLFVYDRARKTSVPLNIAEGAAEFSPKEKVRLYRLARRELCECAAILDQIDHILGVTHDATEVRAMLEETLRLLSNTMLSVERSRV